MRGNAVAAALIAAAALWFGIVAIAAEDAQEGAFERKLVRVAEPFAPPVNPIAQAAGRESGLAAHKGKVVVAVFWATWCPICLKEMPVLDELAVEMGPEGVVVLPLSVDDGDAEAKVTAYYEQHLLENLPVAVDIGGVTAGMMGLRGTPTAFILNKEGLVVGAIEGDGHWDSDAARAYLRALLAE